MHIGRLLIPFTAALLIAPAPEAQSPGPESIAESRYMEHVKFLASDDLAGRGNGTPGLERAAQYIADQFPAAHLAPSSGFERARLQQWLCFIGTELHKATFIPLFDKSMPEAVRAKTLEKGAARLAYLDKYLTGREFLLDRFTVADAYLFTVLNWAQAVSLDLKAWPNVMAYYKHMRLRPSIAQAFREELALYQAEQKRHQAA